MPYNALCYVNANCCLRLLGCFTQPSDDIINRALGMAKRLLQFLVMQILSLLLSLFYCVSARLQSLIQPTTEEYCVVGLNYGGRADQNGEAMASYLVSREIKVIYAGLISPNFDVQVLDRGAYQAAKAFLNARAIYYTHSLSDILPAGHKLYWFSRILSFPFSAFFQHVVIGVSEGEQLISVEKVEESEDDEAESGDAVGLTDTTDANDHSDSDAVVGDDENEADDEQATDDDENE